MVVNSVRQKEISKAYIKGNFENLTSSGKYYVFNSKIHTHKKIICNIWSFTL